MHFFITNDDSHRSPLLHLLIDYLAQCGEITIVVPKHEQSWKGKSISRFQPLHVETIDLFGRKAYTVDGTPADCVNLGLHHLCPTRPDLVISGINAGENSGSAFLLCSGTVGAAFEANLAGYPALALSQLFTAEMWSHYIPEYRLEAEVSGRLIQQTKMILDSFFTSFYQVPHCLTSPFTWNMNFPLHLREPLQIKFTQTAKMNYGSLFKGNGVAYEHSLGSLAIESAEPESDSLVMRAGEVSVTLLDPHSFGRGGNPELKNIERAFLAAR